MYVEGEAASYRWVETVTEWERIMVVGETDRDAERTKATTTGWVGGFNQGQMFFYLTMLV